jgi:NAD(P)H-flavin reductase/hemoglobin-like flavoprotein
MLGSLLKESWTVMEDQADDLVNSFYSRMFLAEPDLRELFPVSMADQRARLVEALVAAIDTVDDPDRFGALMMGLGRAHRRFHVAPEHYAIAGPALLGALREFAGEHWCIEYDQAWRDLYDAMATQMLAGAEREALTPPFWAAEVVAHERRGQDVAVLRLRPFAEYPFRAGQYLHVECGYHPREWRPYSIANAPRADGTLDLHIRDRDGWVAAALVRRVRPGDIVRLGQPLGTMRIDPAEERDLVCVAGGTGLAAMKSLVDQLTREPHRRWVHLFVGARTADDLYDLAELDRLAARHPWLSVVPVCSDDETYGGETGLVSDAVERFGPWPAHEFFLCGPPPMVRASLAALSRMDVSPFDIQYDALSSYEDSQASVVGSSRAFEAMRSG